MPTYFERKFSGKFWIIQAISTVVMIAINGPYAIAYSPGNHEKSVVDGAKICLSRYAVTLSKSEIEGIIVGAREPDSFSISTLEMLKQRVEPGSYGTQRNISLIRIAAQSIHGSPNPTRRIYTSSRADIDALKRTIRIPNIELLKNRLPLNIYSYDTNQGVRNKILINASQFLCVSLAHKTNAQSTRKFGNFLHMIADTYSASHVQRSRPKSNLSNCGTEKIEWHFSMDLVSWKRHRPADLNSSDWRFRCLVSHTADLMRDWHAGRRSVVATLGRVEKRISANHHVKNILKRLCLRVLKEDPAVLRRPAGGASAAYSSAGGTDYWRLFQKKRPDLAIQPVGLTGPKEAQAFYTKINRDLKAKGYTAEFSYPSRNMPNLCENILASTPLHPALQCTRNEIDWAMNGSVRVQSMWIPARKLP